MTEPLSGVVTDAEASRGPSGDWEMKSNVQWKDGRMPKPGESFTLISNPVSSLLEAPEDVDNTVRLRSRLWDYLTCGGKFIVWRDMEGEHKAIAIGAVVLLVLKICEWNGLL